MAMYPLEGGFPQWAEDAMATKADPKQREALERRLRELQHSPFGQAVMSTPDSQIVDKVVDDPELRANAEVWVIRAAINYFTAEMNRLSKEIYALKQAEAKQEMERTRWREMELGRLNQPSGELHPQRVKQLYQMALEIQASSRPPEEKESMLKKLAKYFAP